MSVYRTRPLPSSHPAGRLLVAAAVVDATLESLRKRRGRDGRHEGLVFWAGRSSGPDTLVLSAVVPVVRSSPGSVHAAESEVGRAARAVRRLGLGILVQVHSHPGDDTRHSDGDDDLVLMPFEGMWSLVVARYGDVEFEGPGAVGVHQFLGGRWCWIPSEAGAVAVVPATAER